MIILTVSLADLCHLEENIKMVEDSIEIAHHLVGQAERADLFKASVSEWLLVDDCILGSDEKSWKIFLTHNIKNLIVVSLS